MNTRLALLALCAAMVLQCGSRDERLDQWVQFEGPYAVGSTLVYLDRNFDEILVIAPEAGDLSPHFERLAVEKGSTVAAVLDSEKAILLQSVDKGVVQAVYPEKGKVETFEMDSPYDRFVVRHDPPLVVAYFSEGAQGGEESLFLTKGQIGFIDVTADKEPVTGQTLKTYGGAPTGADIAPPAELGSTERQFVFVRWNSWISMVELGGEKMDTVSIPLKPPDSEASVIPGSMKFVAEPGRLRAFFLAGASDLYVIDIDLATLAPGGAGVNVNVFPAANGASKFEPYVGKDGALGIVVACTTARMVAVVFPDTSEVKLYPVDVNPRKLSLFDIPGSGELGAFVFDDSGNSSSYYFVELDQLQEKKSKAFHYYTLLSPISRVYMLGGGDHFLALHPSGESDSMSMVSVIDGSVLSFGAGQTIHQEVFSADGNVMYTLATKGASTYLSSVDFAEPDALAKEKINISNGPLPDRLIHLEKQGLLVAADSLNETLLVAPEDFEEREEAVQLFAPYLFGLEH